ncbi:MAG: hypothetical protein H6977_06960 [Gammaproteobacteria bacterium]|nr:hypothetical protein [Gammaproteobacteria bacterium]MCP5199733.1 hypothetical protein [Gammaproteobacteria bacterium]
MKNLIATLSLVLVTNVASADGFAPWNARMAAADTVGSPAMTLPAGFAPWRDRDYVPDMADPNVRFGAMPSVFRPWS